MALSRSSSSGPGWLPVIFGRHWHADLASTFHQAGLRCKLLHLRIFHQVSCPLYGGHKQYCTFDDAPASTRTVGACSNEPPFANTRSRYLILLRFTMETIYLEITSSTKLWPRSWHLSTGGPLSWATFLRFGYGYSYECLHQTDDNIAAFTCGSHDLASNSNSSLQRENRMVDKRADCGIGLLNRLKNASHGLTTASSGEHWNAMLLFNKFCEDRQYVFEEARPGSEREHKGIGRVSKVKMQNDLCASNNYVRIQGMEGSLWGSYAAVQGAASNTLDGCVAASPSCMIWLRKTQRRVTWKAIRGQDMQTCSKLHKWTTTFLRYLSLAIPHRVLYGVFCIETLLRWEPRLFAIYGLRLFGWQAEFLTKASRQCYHQPRQLLLVRLRVNSLESRDEMLRFYPLGAPIQEIAPWPNPAIDSSSGFVCICSVYSLTVWISLTAESRRSSFFFASPKANLTMLDGWDILRLQMARSNFLSVDLSVPSVTALVWVDTSNLNPLIRSRGIPHPHRQSRVTLQARLPIVFASIRTEYMDAYFPYLNTSFSNYQRKVQQRKVQQRQVQETKAGRAEISGIIVAPGKKWLLRRCNHVQPSTCLNEPSMGAGYPTCGCGIPILLIRRQKRRRPTRLCGAHGATVHIELVRELVTSPFTPSPAAADLLLASSLDICKKRTTGCPTKHVQATMYKACWPLSYPPTMLSYRVVEVLALSSEEKGGGSRLRVVSVKRANARRQSQSGIRSLVQCNSDDQQGV
ncbi:uncharacterized protein CLUP02_00828 [Colletotrichum lupini]|uniref:Uncharacterized protein n=1 Tax=Colletotrichum lupini TaxID=145971 RepID=A0A9Q8W9C1_9PEZI|nr:uncharacterized protein CLUP02_00828 [Colletotrichum lupini]UQC74180.1 hypothetical protein CLUP02_00828 [Colletotrichum lupini]